MIVADLDNIAAAIERRWGIGRLPLLVPADLAARFAKMTTLYRDGGHTPQLVAGMARAWQALDAAAEAAGALDAASLTWEAVRPSYGVETDPDRPWYILEDDSCVVEDETHRRRVEATARALGVTTHTWTPVEYVHFSVARNPMMMASILKAGQFAQHIREQFDGSVIMPRARAPMPPADGLDDILPLPSKEKAA